MESDCRTRVPEIFIERERERERERDLQDPGIKTRERERERERADKLRRSERKKFVGSTRERETGID